MKQIKTIKNRLDNNVDFDKEVNAAIEEGWILKKREVISPYAQPNAATFHTMLYAELEWEIIREHERCCENCRHNERVLDDDAPCHECGDHYEKWEEESEK